MPARIERFQQEIGVRDVQGTRPVIEQPADAGGAFRQLGRTILRESEPYVRRDAQKRAERDANAMTLKKNPDGSIEQMGDEREHYGTVYADTFEKIMRERRGAIYQSTIEETLSKQQAEHFLDPDKFLEVSNGYLAGMLEAVNPEDRAFVEATGLREQTQRNNALISEKRRRDWGIAVDAVQANMNALRTDTVNKLFVGDDIEGALVEYGEGMAEFWDEMKVLGAANPELARAKMREMNAELWDEARFAVERETFGDLFPKIDSEETTLDDVRNLALFMQGSNVDGATVFGKTAEEWRQDIQTPDGRRLLEGYANEIERRRITALNAEEQRLRAEREANDREEQIKLWRKIASQNSGPGAVSGLTDEEYLGAVVAYQEHGLTAEQMQSPEGRARTLGFIMQTGVHPPDLDEYLNHHASGGRIVEITEFVDGLNDIVWNDTPVGLNIFNSLKPDTKAAIMIDMAMSRNGESLEKRRAQAQAFAAGQMPSMTEVYDSYGGKSEYLEQRTEWLEDKLGLSEAQARTILGSEDFDVYVRTYSRAYGPGSERALEQAAMTVARQWTKSNLFLDGVAPMEVAKFGATARDFDVGLRPDTFSQNRTGATFANGMAKLVPESVGPDRAIGWYRIQFFRRDGNGNMVPDDISEPIELDGFIDEFARRTKQDRDKMADQAMSLAREQRRRRSEPLSPRLQREQDRIFQGPKY